MQLGHGVVLGSAAGGEEPAQFVRTFAEAAPGELIVYEDAYRRLAVAVSHGDAAARLGLARATSCGSCPREPARPSAAAPSRHRVDQ